MSNMPKNPCYTIYKYIYSIWAFLPVYDIQVTMKACGPLTVILLERFPVLGSTSESIHWIICMYGISCPISTVVKLNHMKEVLFGHFDGRVNHQLCYLIFCREFIYNIGLGFVWYAASVNIGSKIRLQLFHTYYDIIINIPKNDCLVWRKKAC